jgi:hypothetical protein
MALTPLHASSVAAVVRLDRSTTRNSSVEPWRDSSLPGWWILITGAADILALAILLSPPIRRWVAKKPAPVP